MVYRRSRGLVAFVCLMCTGCSTPSATGETAVSAPIMPTTTTVRLADDLRVTAAISLDATDACRIADATDTHSATNNSPSTSGFPRRAMAAPTTSLRLLIVPVSTPDVPFGADDHAALVAAMPEFKRYFETVSYGRAVVSYDIADVSDHVILNRTAESFGLIPGDRANTWDFIRAAAREVPARYDVTSYDVVAFEVGANPAANFWGTAIPMPDDPVRAESGEVKYATLSGGWQPASWRLIAHEVAHVWLGFEDLYTTEPNPDYDGTFWFWDLMNSYRGEAPELISWHRFLTGWLIDDQIRCVSETAPKTSIHFLSPVQDASPTPKAIVRPLGNGAVLVVESRRKMGYDVAEPGVLVYVFDTSIPGGRGPIIARGELTLDPARRPIVDRFVIPLGDELTTDGVRVTLLASDESGDLIQFDIL
jgi:M6 family metalloprotease-like protein